MRQKGPLRLARPRMKPRFAPVQPLNGSGGPEKPKTRACARGSVRLSRMIFGLVRRCAGLLCTAFAAYAFVKVPIGRKTGWEHTVAIFSTEPAREAATDLKDLALRSYSSTPTPGPAPTSPSPRRPGATREDPHPVPLGRSRAVKRSHLVRAPRTTSTDLRDLDRRPTDRPRPDDLDRARTDPTVSTARASRPDRGSARGIRPSGDLDSAPRRGIPPAGAGVVVRPRPRGRPCSTRSPRASARPRNRLAGLTELTESNIDAALREVRLCLLEADVELGVVKTLPRPREGEGARRDRPDARRRQPAADA